MPAEELLLTPGTMTLYGVPLSPLDIRKTHLRVSTPGNVSSSHHADSLGCPPIKGKKRDGQCSSRLLQERKDLTACSAVILDCIVSSEEMKNMEPSVGLPYLTGMGPTVKLANMLMQSLKSRTIPAFRHIWQPHSSGSMPFSAVSFLTLKDRKGCTTNWCGFMLSIGLYSHPNFRSNCSDVLASPQFLPS